MTDQPITREQSERARRQAEAYGDKWLAGIIEQQQQEIARLRVALGANAILATAQVGWKDRAEKAEQRVAELERLLLECWQSMERGRAYPEFDETLSRRVLRTLPESALTQEPTND